MGVLKFGDGPIKSSRLYKFTSKSQSTRGIMATVFGTIAMVSFIVVIISSFRNRVYGTARMGATGFLAAIFAALGVYLGVRSLYEKEKFVWFPRVGTLISLLALACWGYVLLIGLGVLTI